MAEENAEVSLGVIDAHRGFAADLGNCAHADREFDPVGVGIIDRKPVEFDLEAIFREDGGPGGAGSEVVPAAEVLGLVEADTSFAAAGAQHIEAISDDAVLDHGRPQLDGGSEQAAPAPGLRRGVEVRIVRRVEIVRQDIGGL